MLAHTDLLILNRSVRCAASSRPPTATEPRGGGVPRTVDADRAIPAKPATAPADGRNGQGPGAPRRPGGRQPRSPMAQPALAAMPDSLRLCLLRAWRRLEVRFLSTPLVRALDVVTDAQRPRPAPGTYAEAATEWFYELLYRCPRPAPEPWPPDVAASTSAKHSILPRDWSPNPPFLVIHSPFPQARPTWRPAMWRHGDLPHATR